ncbi:Platinum sensitivity protein [Malassezia vespertilionis]|uniref:Psy2p n=1 Tax=Malassezia vespertilionis TaxID=2020962 RepID=A0A2N1J8Q4_9BASI|nr:Platinum sensitivity protein [Malassezia vespertilionis]PKI82928.1 Psy2p [Malassezia vespertilionis]WFD08267.1 Platinum sensitivity protein [Malassezia vespertilionis]
MQQALQRDHVDDASEPLRDFAPPTEQGEGSDAPTQLLFSSTVTRGNFHQCGSGRRVKLYALKGQAWMDCGTGYCAGVYNEEKDEALLVVRKEEFCESIGDVADAAAPVLDAPQSYMLVVRASLDTDDFILCSPVAEEDVYQRQQDTLVVWTEPDGTDLALSFQELEGCNEVWEFLSEVQHHFLLNGEVSFSAWSDKSKSALDPEFSGELDDAPSRAPFALPLPELDNLGYIDAALRDACMHSVLTREKAIEWVLSTDYIRKLIPKFDAAEHGEDLAALHRLYNIMRTLVTVNDNVLVEYLLQEDVFFAAIGMLEYSPALPTMKIGFREFMQHTVQHHVVDFDATMETKIAETYRLVYLKDVVFAQFMDDALLSMMGSLVYFYQSDIVTHCVTNPRCLEQLLEIVANSDAAQKREAVQFLQQLCAMAKQVQLAGRVNLFRTLVERDVLRIVEYALAQSDRTVRNAGAYMLSVILEYDAGCVRQYVQRQLDSSERPFLTMLVDLLHATPDLGLKGQLAEMVKSLLDVTQEQHEKKSAESERYLTWVYEACIESLFTPLKTLPLGAPARVERHAVPDAMLYTLLCDLLCFIVQQHSFRSQFYVLTSDVLKHSLTLLQAREKTLRLAAVRVLCVCLASNNQFTHRHLVAIGALAEMLRVLELEAPRDNLVSSAVLGFFELIRRNDMQKLASELRASHRSAMERLASIPASRACFSHFLLHEGVQPEQTSPESLDGLQAGDEENYFASEEATPLVPYSDDDEEEEGKEEEIDTETLDLSLEKMRRRKCASADEDDGIARLAKRKHTSRDAPMIPELPISANGQRG